MLELFNKAKEQMTNCTLIKGIVILCLALTISACGGGGTSSSSGPNNNDAYTYTLNISSLAESSIVVGESTTASVTLSASPETTTPVVVNITSSDNTILGATPVSCSLTTAANNCTITLTGKSIGNASFSAVVTGYTSVQSASLRVKLIPSVVFVNFQELVYQNSTLLSGESPIASIDGGWNVVQNSMSIASNGDIYVGMNGIAIYNYGVVWKYPANGTAWILVRGTGDYGSLDNSSVNSVITDSAGNLYAATDGGNVFKYAKSATSWTQMGVGLGTQLSSLVLDNNESLYTGANDGFVYKYVNGSWVSLGSPDGSGVTTLTFDNNNLLHAGTSNGSVFKYTGAIWSGEGIPDGSSISAIAFDSNGAMYASYGSGSGGVSIYNGATSWTSLGNPGSTTKVGSLAIHNNVIYAGAADGLVYNYVSGTTWVALATVSPTAVNIAAVRFNSGGLLYAATQDGSNVFQYNSNDARWLQLGNGSLDSTSPHGLTIDESENFYVATDANVLIYPVSSKRWQILGTPNYFGYTTSIVAHNLNSLYVGANAGRVFHYVNNDWEQLGTSFAGSDDVLAIVLSDSNVLYAGTNIGQMWRYESDNDWIMLAGSGSNGSLDNSQISAAVIDPLGSLYAGTAGNSAGGLVWKLLANTSTWLIVGPGTPDNSEVRSLIRDSDDILYVGTSKGNVLKYMANGIAWVMVGTGSLDGTPVNSLAIDSGGSLYALTAGGNVFKWPLGGLYWINTGYANGSAFRLGCAVGM